MTWSPEAIIELGALGLAVLTPIGVMIKKLGRLEEAVKNLSSGMKERRQAERDIVDKIETTRDTLGAEILKLHDALLSADIPLPPPAINGGLHKISR